MISLLLAASLAPKSYVPPPSKVVVYEANLRALGPKVGFKTLEGRLDSIKALGVNVLWIMPIQPVGREKSAGGMGSPYAVADYYSTNPEFGSKKDFANLVEAAHKRNLAVILDWVPNHTAWDHPWVKQHPNWYTKDAAGKMTPPAGTNWQDVADLDYGNREMRRAMIAAMKWWLQEFKIDGYRVDTADFLPSDFWKEAVPQIRAASGKRILMLAEGFRPDHHAAGFDLSFGWPFFDGLKEIFGGKSAQTLRDAVNKEQEGLPKGARRLRFTTNHDKAAWEGTTAEFFKSPSGARAALFGTLLLGGTPLIYTGQEVDWQQRIPIFEHSTIDWARNAGKGKWIGQLVRLRNANPALCDGSFSDISTDDAIVYEKWSGKHRALIVINVRNSPVKVALRDHLRGSWTDGLTGRETVLGSSLTIQGYGHKVWIKGNRP